MTTAIKTWIKKLLRLPADAFVSSSRNLPDHVHWAMQKRLSRELFDEPLLAAKFIPTSPEDESVIIPKPGEFSGVRDEHGLPVPETAELLMGLETAEQYLQRGRDDMGAMLRLLESFGRSFKAGDRILDFGCGTGRLVRHLHHLSDQCEIWGTDIHDQRIRWCRHHLTPPFHFLTTTTFPHLPFEDGYFACIYAGSVFTHIFDLADMWFSELRRILRKGGLLYITIHDEAAIKTLLNERVGGKLTRKLVPFDEKTGVLDSEFGMFTVSRRPSGAEVFFNREYLLALLSGMFKFVGATESAFDYQTGVLLERI